MRRAAAFLALLLFVPLVVASPHDEAPPTHFAESLVASWRNSITEASDGETAPWVATHMAENLRDNLRVPGRLLGEGLAVWPWGADHPDFQEPPGLVLAVAFTNALGHRLEGDLWLPPDVALVDGELVGARHAGLVLTPGFTAGRDMYAWLLERLAADGYVVLAWDPQGQGTSGGPAATADDYQRDLKLAIGWFHSSLNPARHLATGEFGLVGHSQGANAAFWLGTEEPYASRVRALVALSSSWLNETVTFPVQAWTGDYDGGQAQPAYLGANYGATDYEDLKPKYDAWLAGEKQLLVAAEATHDSWTNIPFVYGDGRTHATTWRYVKPFLDRYVRGDASRATFEAMVTPVDGLSKAYASEYDLALATSGITRGAAASLGLDPAPFAERLLQLDAGDCRVSGHARDPAGRALRGAAVSYEGLEETTDASGWFAFHRVAAGGALSVSHPFVAARADVDTDCDVAGATPGSGGVGPAFGSVAWDGRTFAAGAAPVADACTPATCDEFVVSVVQPLARSRTEFSIRWESEGDDFDLAVYDAAGGVVGQSTGAISTAESVIASDLPSGSYRVVVVPVAVASSDYEGLVQLEPAAAPPVQPKELLPDLVPLPPKNLRLEAPVFYATGTGASFGTVRPLSCYADETAEHGVRRCLRFDNAIANFGEGRLELRYRTENAIEEPADSRMVQRVHRSDGATRDRDAGPLELHAIHGHFHYKDFARYQLFNVDEATGQRLGPASNGTKAGFCLIDVALEWWNRVGNEPRRHAFPNCDAPTEFDDAGSWMVQGIGVGWADVYTWDLPGQYVDVTDVPDGVYDLVSVVDPTSVLAELDRSNNEASVRLRLDGDTVTYVDS